MSWVEAAGALFLPVVCYGELRFGALHSRRASENLTKLEAFVALCTVLDATPGVAVRYGEVRQSLAAKGTPIPEADLWIAAICLEHDLPIFSDDAHFDHFPRLERYDWRQPPP